MGSEMTCIYKKMWDEILRYFSIFYAGVTGLKFNCTEIYRLYREQQIFLKSASRSLFDSESQNLFISYLLRGYFLRHCHWNDVHTCVGRMCECTTEWCMCVLGSEVRAVTHAQLDRWWRSATPAQLYSVYSLHRWICLFTLLMFFICV